MGECAKTDYRNRKWIRRGTGTGTFKCVSILELQSSLSYEKAFLLAFLGPLSEVCQRMSHSSRFMETRGRDTENRIGAKFVISLVLGSTQAFRVLTVRLLQAALRRVERRRLKLIVGAASKVLGGREPLSYTPLPSKVSNAWQLHWYLQKGSCFRRLGGGQENIRSLQLRFCRGGKE
jgi:hypothetical protein